VGNRQFFYEGVGVKRDLVTADLHFYNSFIRLSAPGGVSSFSKWINFMLQSKLIILDEMTKADAQSVFEFASHDQVAKTVTWEAHRNVQESQDYIEKVSGQYSLELGKVFICWGARERKTNRVVGLVSLTQLGPIRAQLGYVFHFDHWNRAVPLEALRLMLDYAFQNFPFLERIQSRCLPSNVTSKALLERLGMNYEGTNYSMLRVNNQNLDLTCYAMTRDRWNAILSFSPAGFSLYEDLLDHI
jgi:ribosomal-protein-alanine N-acetyltransferase